MSKQAYIKRIRRKLEVLRLDAKAGEKHQLVHDLGECLTIVDNLERIIDRIEE